MKKTGGTKCPYCGDSLNYAKAWALRKRGEYICPKCGGLSNVHFGSAVYTLGFFAILLGAACFAVGLIFDSSFAPYTLGGIFLVFIAFFLVSPFFVRLKKPAPPRQKQAPRRNGPQEHPEGQRGAEQ